MKSNRVAEYFDKHVVDWDTHYENEHEITGYEVIRRRQLAIESLTRCLQIEDALVLEVGCGTGRVLASAIEDRPTWRGIGLDVSEQMVRSCQVTYRDYPQLAFECHDIEEGLVPYMPDAILALGVIGYLQQFESAIANIHKILKVGGYFIFTINKELSIPGQVTTLYRHVYSFIRTTRLPGLSRGISSLELSQALAGRFQIVESRDYCYLPYLPVIRRLVFISKGLESVWGHHITPLSSTTLYLTQKLGI